MPDFVVNFDAPMKAAEAKGSLSAMVVTEAIVGSKGTLQGKAEDANSVAADLSKTVDSIERELKQLSAGVVEQQRQLSATAVAYAMEVVSVLLGSMDELVERRLQQNIERVLDSPYEIESAKIHVHPDCRDAVLLLLSVRSDVENKTETALVVGDPGLAKGDCRVDFGASGRIATLDDQLRLIRARLEQAIRDEQAEKRND